MEADASIDSARSMDRVDKAIWSLKSLIEATDRPQLPDQIEGLVYLGLRTTCRGGGMADAADLKSVVRKDVRVRLPPSAPSLRYLPQWFALGLSSPETFVLAVVKTSSH